MSPLEALGVAMLYTVAVGFGLWLIFAALRWLGARSPWRRK
jgi:hypothetical protein